MNDIKQDLIEDEGVSYKVYRDTLGNLTVGIGHLITDGDNLQVGDTISDERVNELFLKDLHTAMDDAERAIGRDAYSILTGGMKRAIINMCFNLGYTRFSRFKRFIRYIREGKYFMAGPEILKSKAAKQLPKRYNRIFKLFMESII